MTAQTHQPTPAANPRRRATNTRVFTVVYGAVWAATLLAMAAGAIFPSLRSLAPTLRLYPHAHPSTSAAAVLFAHNARAAGWPLLFAWLNLHNEAWRRRLVSILLPGFLIANAALVGITAAASGPAIVPYLVHLPVEWAAITVAATGWLLQAADAIPRHQLAAICAGFLALLAIAAALETYAVPHL